VFHKLQVNYLRGMSGYLLVADGTRPSTLEEAYFLYRDINSNLGHIPFVLLINKSDLSQTWSIDDDSIKDLGDRGWPVLKASAKTGARVEEAFKQLATDMYKAG
jgi:signal recognition particle receptor subunit beta